MEGGLLKSSAALAISAAAIGPSRCAWRPFSASKVSNTPKDVGPKRSAYHWIVPASAFARAHGCPEA